MRPGSLPFSGLLRGAPKAAKNRRNFCKSNGFPPPAQRKALPQPCGRALPAAGAPFVPFFAADATMPPRKRSREEPDGMSRLFSRAIPPDQPAKAAYPRSAPVPSALGRSGSRFPAVPAWRRGRCARCPTRRQRRGYCRGSGRGFQRVPVPHGTGALRPQRAAVPLARQGRKRRAQARVRPKGRKEGLPPGSADPEQG